MSKAINKMTDGGESIVGNATQKMNQLSSKAQAEYRRTMGDLNTQIGKMEGKLNGAQNDALNVLKKHQAALKQAHVNATSGNVQGYALGNLMNGLKKSEEAAKQALEKAKQAGKSAAKFTKDVAKVSKQVASQNTSNAQGKVHGGPMSNAKRFGPITSGGRKRRTRRKRRRKGRKSRRSRRKRRKGRKSRRSRRKRRKGKKSRRKKRRTRRRR